PTRPEGRRPHRVRAGSRPGWAAVCRSWDGCAVAWSRVAHLVEGRAEQVDVHLALDLAQRSGGGEDADVFAALLGTEEVAAPVPGATSEIAGRVDEIPVFQGGVAPLVERPGRLPLGRDTDVVVVRDGRGPGGQQVDDPAQTLVGAIEFGRCRPRRERVVAQPDHGGEDAGEALVAGA